MILDAGVLISVDRGERSALALAPRAADAKPLHTTHAVVAQVWRDGARQARLAKFLRTVTIHPLEDGKEVGHLLANSGRSDVVDAHLVHLALQLGDAVLTGDSADLKTISNSLGDAGPPIHPWP
ncbi:MAG: type II toxin-antitoxin system VapC family toxin [Acidimicrobiales bacterium]|nr:hypothetical protein [Acidimicrobiaceae bacterium]MYA25825.1 type II toxin-antitoxin system VapC family toxin [Acidimicrobiales bacterium]MYD83517.1 type II toxin-antitoxin system VapC family toxin [Acidimicrobiales bacterium]MYJ66249.1 type II toxin-antitoxin system VapC family toxin [Acidimicrobiales bacterium]